MSKLLVAIPCLNEAATIRGVIEDVPRKFSGISDVVILVVDDGSTDDTGNIAAEAGVCVIRHNRNRGVGAAFHTALNYAINQRFDYMVNIDGDRQFNPADIPKLLEPIFSGRADMTTASRFKDRSMVPDMPRVKLVGNHMMSFLVSRLCGQQFADVSCGFRAYSREALLQLNIHGKFTYTQESFIDLMSKRIQIEEVPISVRYFPDRKSRVAGSILKYAVNTFSIIGRIYRDYFPMRFFLWGAAVCMAPAVIFGAMFWLHYFETGKFTGYLYAGVVSGFFLLSSLLLVLVGVITDMLDRIRTNQERILYTLKSK